MKEKKSSGEIFRETTEAECIIYLTNSKKKSNLEKIVGRISPYFKPYRLFD
jgi:hypothetical protein